MLMVGRDGGFRKCVVDASNLALTFRGCVETRNRKLKAFAMATAMGPNQTIVHTSPAVEGVVGACDIKFDSRPSV